MEVDECSTKTELIQLINWYKYVMIRAVNHTILRSGVGLNGGTESRQNRWRDYTFSKIHCKYLVCGVIMSFSGEKNSKKKVYTWMRTPALLYARRSNWYNLVRFADRKFKFPVILLGAESRACSGHKEDVAQRSASPHRVCTSVRHRLSHRDRDTHGFPLFSHRYRLAVFMTRTHTHTHL